MNNPTVHFLSRASPVLCPMINPCRMLYIEIPLAFVYVTNDSKRSVAGG